jgi:hypothetical protein
MNTVREYDTSKHLSIGARVVLVAVAIMAFALALGYWLCFGVIRGEIWWTIIAVSGIVMAYGLFGGRRRQQMLKAQPQPVAYEQPVDTSEMIQAYPSGNLSGDVILMSFRGQPYNWTQFDPITDQPEPSYR